MAAKGTVCQWNQPTRIPKHPLLSYRTPYRIEARFHGWKARALWPLPPFPHASLNPHVHWGPATLVPSCSLKHTTVPTSVPLHLLLLEPGMFFPWAVAQLTMIHSDSLQHHFLREASSDRHPPPSATVIFTRVSLFFMTPITAPEVVSKSCICLSHHKLCENQVLSVYMRV